MVERLYPDHAPEALDDVYAELGDESPWLLLGMVASVDGAVTVDGRSGGLGGDGDLAGFRGLRAAADVILVGAGTARTEGYGPPRMRESDLARRRTRGQHDLPAIAVVSSSLDLSGAERLLQPDRDRWTLLVITTSAAPDERVDDLRAQGAEIVVAGGDRVDPAAAVAALRERGLDRILAEGGPSLNRDLLRAGVVTGLCLTVAPDLVGGASQSIVADGALERTSLTLRSVRRHGSEILLRYDVER